MKKFKLFFAYHPFDPSNILNPDSEIVEAKTLEKAIKQLRDELGAIEVFKDKSFEVK